MQVRILLKLYPFVGQHIDCPKDSLINCTTSCGGHAALKEENNSLGHRYQARTVIAHEQSSATTSTSTRQQAVCLSDVSEEICQQQLSLSTHAHPVCLLLLISKVRSNLFSLNKKPFGPCQFCGRMFTQLSHLQQHIRTHTGKIGPIRFE